jgi:hypothetical protein
MRCTTAKRVTKCVAQATCSPRPRPFRVTMSLRAVKTIAVRNPNAFMVEATRFDCCKKAFAIAGAFLATTSEP